MNTKIPVISIIVIFSLKKYFEDIKLKNISTCPNALTKDAWIKVKAKNHDNVAKNPANPAKQLSNLLSLNFLNSDLSKINR